MALQLQSLAGVIIIPLVVWIISENRRSLGPGRALVIAVTAISVQLAIALLFLKMPYATYIFDGLAAAVLSLQKATDTGSQLLFGYLAGGEAPFTPSKPEHAFLVAFRVLPMILVLSAIVRVLYYWGVLQRVVAVFAFLLKRTVGTGGPLGTVSASSIFMGLVEAPLMIRPYIKDMDRGALFATMVVVMATVAGTVMALYASILSTVVPGAAGHLLAASLMNIPGALMLARFCVPDGFEAKSEDPVSVQMDDPPQSSMDAVAAGTYEGLKLVATVAAMLVVIVSLVALVNMILAGLTAPFGVNITLEGAFGMAMAPVAFLIGIPWSEAFIAGGLLGQKLILNEFLAYLELAKTPLEGDGSLSERSRFILTYALCGFANLGSLGILVGGLGTMAPDRRAEIVELAPKSVLIGFLATLLSAALIGCITWS